MCASIAALWLVLFASSVALGQQPLDRRPSITAVERIEMTVGDMDRSLRFFTDVLECEVIRDVTAMIPGERELVQVANTRIRQADLKLGDEYLRLTEYLDDRGDPMPADSRGNDHWFQHVAIIVSDMDRAYAKLREHKVKHASSGPQTLPEWNLNAAGIRAFYFRDPDGHFLEILKFPEDKGDAKWHQVSDRLFLGIDHTAIVVSDTDESLKFYRDELGLSVAGESENHGFEQEHLNGVFGARLRITTLRAPAGPGIELLEYLSPTDGRAMPSHVRPQDILYWKIHLAADSKARVTAGSSGFATVVLHDPNGHWLSIRTQQGTQR
ncbi:MAG TPA: VOC family protein [Pirellulaceae bacterium]|nr:VOC family protein [Pirellulaceae bacterium]